MYRYKSNEIQFPFTFEQMEAILENNDSENQWHEGLMGSYIDENVMVLESRYIVGDEYGGANTSARIGFEVVVDYYPDSDQYDVSVTLDRDDAQDIATRSYFDTLDYIASKLEQYTDVDLSDVDVEHYNAIMNGESVDTILGELGASYIGRTDIFDDKSLFTPFNVAYVPEIEDEIYDLMWNALAARFDML